MKSYKNSKMVNVLTLLVLCVPVSVIYVFSLDGWAPKLNELVGVVVPDIVYAVVIGGYNLSIGRYLYKYYETINKKNNRDIYGRSSDVKQ